MPLKKKKNKTQPQASDMMDPMTLMSAVQAAGTQTAKPKKKKLTKAEKAKASMDKSADAFSRSGAPFVVFFDRIDTWLNKHNRQLIHLFSKFDDGGSDVVTWDEFKSGLLDLGVPCNQVELHLLCHLLDQNGQDEIEFMKLQDGLTHVRERAMDYAEDVVRPVLTLTSRSEKDQHCPRCKMLVWDGPQRPPVPRYVLVLFRAIAFESFKEHPGHFEELVHNHITVSGLIQRIIEHTQIRATQMGVFTQKTREPEYQLCVDDSLEDKGFVGGSKDNPEELLLYYDYKVDLVDCPILMCDHYFGQS